MLWTNKGGSLRVPWRTRTSCQGLWPLRKSALSTVFISTTQLTTMGSKTLGEGEKTHVSTVWAMWVTVSVCVGLWLWTRGALRYRTRCSEMPNWVWKQQEHYNSLASPVLRPFFPLHFLFCQKNISYAANHSRMRYPVGLLHCCKIKWPYEPKSISKVSVLKLPCATCHKGLLQCYVISQNSISRPLPASPRWRFISWQ